MRTIKFRGLRVDGKGWVYGYYFKAGRTQQHAIRVSESGGVLLDQVFEVKPETVGAFTGLTDKNGTEVFEGDRVEISMLEMVVGYSETYAGFTLNRIETGQIFVYNINAKVIAVRGNIHEQ
jgi:uncharacterized phage protein (TIGR01671 family)